MARTLLDGARGQRIRKAKCTCSAHAQQFTFSRRAAVWILSRTAMTFRGTRSVDQILLLQTHRASITEQSEANLEQIFFHDENFRVGAAKSSTNSSIRTELSVWQNYVGFWDCS